MKLTAFALALSLGCGLPGARALNATWSPAEAEGPMPLSKRYRDKVQDAAWTR